MESGNFVKTETSKNAYGGSCYILFYFLGGCGGIENSWPFMVPGDFTQSLVMFLETESNEDKH